MDTATPWRQQLLNAETQRVFLPLLLALPLAALLVWAGPTVMAALLVALVGSVLFLVNVRTFVLTLIVGIVFRTWLSGGERFETAGIDFDLGGLISILLCTTAIAHFGLRARWPFWRLGTVLPYALLIGLLTASFVWSPHVRQGIRLVVRFAAPLAIFLVASDVMNAAMRQRVRDAILLSSVVPLGFGVLQWAAGAGSTITTGLIRVQSCFVHPAVFGMYLAFLFALVYAEFLSVPRRHPELWVAYLALILVMQTTTYTRASWFATALIFVYQSWVFGRRRYLLFGAAALGLVALWVGDTIVERVSQVTTVLGDEDLVDSRGNSIGWRFVFWRSMLEDWRSAPILGQGAGSAILFGYKLMGVWSSPHNGYLRMLYEAGIVGLTLFLWMSAALLNSARRLAAVARSPADRALAHGLVGMTLAFLVLNLTDNIIEYYEVGITLWLMAAVVQSTQRARIAEMS